MTEVPPGKLRDVVCNLCRADDANLICLDQGYRICRCSRCRLIYVTPQPVFGVGSEAPFHADSNVASDPAFRKEKSSVYSQGLTELSRLQLDKGRLLDVGCGFGLFLRQAGEAGWEPFGIDVSDVGVTYARQDLGLSNVKKGDLAESGFTKSFFQAVTLWNVLEHVPDPLQTLLHVHELVAENGVVLVRVPNMLVHNALRLARPVLRPLLGLVGSQLPPYLGGISPPHHLYGFTPGTLRAMLLHAGFSAVDIHPAVSHGARSTVGRVAAAIGNVTYRVSRHRFVLSPAIVAYARATSAGPATGVAPPRGPIN